MKSFALLSFLCFSCTNLFAQNAGKVFYAHSHGILGGTEILLIPEGSFYLLQRNYSGKLGGSFVDTLFSKEGGYLGKRFKVSFIKKRMVLQYLGNSENKSRTERLKYKEYYECSSFVNLRRNWWYARDLYYNSENIARKKLGDLYPQWQERPKHKSEVLYGKNAYSEGSVFGKTCHRSFKLMADSIHNANLYLIQTFKTR